MPAIESSEMADHFSIVAASYAEYRPSYPPELAAYLAGLAPGRSLAWDCGTGSGQAAVLLAEHFARVVATDLSQGQLAHAAPHPRVEYRASPERASGLAAASVDLVTVAQAAHWFDLPAFYAEVDRVLVAGGVLAIWGYAEIRISAEIDLVVSGFEHGRVGRYWPKGRELATSQYRTLPFPYHRLDTPSFVMEHRWTSAEFLGYVGSWSAVARGRQAEGRDPLADVAPELQRLWGPAARDVRWPLHLLVGRRPA
jgi:SAM-dependent methyltransferase